MEQNQFAGGNRRAAEALTDLFVPEDGRSFFWPGDRQIAAGINAVAQRTKKLRPVRRTRSRGQRKPEKMEEPIRHQPVGKDPILSQEELVENSHAWFTKQGRTMATLNRAMNFVSPRAPEPIAAPSPGRPGRGWPTGTFNPNVQYSAKLGASR